MLKAGGKGPAFCEAQRIFQGVINVSLVVLQTRHLRGFQIKH